MGTKYRVGKDTTKIAMIEQFVAPSAGKMASGNVVGLMLVVSIESLKYFSQPESERHTTDYLAMVGVAVVKFAIAAAVGVLVAATLLSATPVIVIAIGAAVFSFVAGLILDKLDENVFGATEAAKRALRHDRNVKKDQELLNKFLNRDYPTL